VRVQAVIPGPLHRSLQTRAIPIRNEVYPDILFDQKQAKCLERQNLFRQDPKTSPAIPTASQRDLDGLEGNMTEFIEPNNASFNPTAGKIQKAPGPALRTDRIISQRFALDGDRFERRIRCWERNGNTQSSRQASGSGGRGCPSPAAPPHFRVASPGGYHPRNQSPEQKNSYPSADFPRVSMSFCPSPNLQSA
jgi:hypothetical protein